jgi:phage gp29-like protein
MSLTKRIINAIKSPTASKPPKPGRVVNPRPADTWRDYPSSNLTPRKLLNILREADAGDPAAAMQLYEEMEEKDPHIYSVANTRRLAVTGLDWTIEPAADASPGDMTRAVEAADHCRKTLRALDRFDDALRHLSLAAGRNIAIAELVWSESDSGLALTDIAPVDFTRIIFDELDAPRILTADQPDNGVDLTGAKFIVHSPQCVAGHPMRGGLLRVTALAYLAKNLALKDWLIFCEVFGMPVRVARYEPNATTEEKKELLHMLENLGANAAGVFSRAVDLDIIDTHLNAATPPYKALIEHLNREISKSWLGQTLTTDTTGTRGSFAATAVHEQVRKDILADDLRAEAATLRRDLLTPLTTFRFGDNAPVPTFRRLNRRVQTPAELTELLDAAVNKLGLAVPTQWVHDRLNIPRAAENEPTVPGKA